MQMNQQGLAEKLQQSTPMGDIALAVTNLFRVNADLEVLKNIDKFETEMGGSFMNIMNLLDSKEQNKQSICDAIENIFQKMQQWCKFSTPMEDVQKRCKEAALSGNMDQLRSEISAATQHTRKSILSSNLLSDQIACGMALFSVARNIQFIFCELPKISLDNDAAAKKLSEASKILAIQAASLQQKITDFVANPNQPLPDTFHTDFQMLFMLSEKYFEETNCHYSTNTKEAQSYVASALGYLIKTSVAAYKIVTFSDVASAFESGWMITAALLNGLGLTTSTYLASKFYAEAKKFHLLYLDASVRYYQLKDKKEFLELTKKNK